MLEKEGNIDWATGEALAIGTLLYQGTGEGGLMAIENSIKRGLGMCC